MDYKKQKKIRGFLINYTNEHINKVKKRKLKFLINSKTLKELEEKNLSCKEFFIEEKTQIFQSIDNRRSIEQKIYMNNNTFCNTIIYPLSQRIIHNNSIKEFINLNEYILNNTYDEKSPDKKLEKVIRQKTRKCIGTKKIINIESPEDQSNFIKKELGERKLKISSKYLTQNLFLNENNNEKIEINNDISRNELEKEKFFSKQYSSITLATEVSRIIKICHNEGINSSLSESRNYKENESVKKAKKYAKKLKFYCRTLKNKYPNINSNKINKLDKNLRQNEFIYKSKDKNYLQTDRSEYNNTKNKEKKKTKKIDKKLVNDKNICKRNRKKKNSEKLRDSNNLLFKISNDNNIINHRSNKRMRSTKDKILKIDKSCYIYSDEQSTCTNNNNQYKTIENKSKINLNKIMKKKQKRKSREENKNRKSKEINSPLKKKKKEIINYVKKIINKRIDIYRNDNNNNNNRGEMKKLSKKIKINDESQKTENTSLFKKNQEMKRISTDTRDDKTGNSILECVFFKSKNLSTNEQFTILKKRKKKNINENNSNTINEPEKFSSINVYTNINKNKLEKKKFKIKKMKTKKIKEHRNTLNYIDNNLEPTRINNKKKLSTEIITLNNNISKRDNKDTSFNLKDKLKKMENNNEESGDDLNNLLDEYLKRKKQKIKNSLK
jgi:hypothetical protein